MAEEYLRSLLQDRHEINTIQMLQEEAHVKGLSHDARLDFLCGKLGVDRYKATVVHIIFSSRGLITTSPKTVAKQVEFEQLLRRPWLAARKAICPLFEPTENPNSLYHKALHNLLVADTIDRYEDRGYQILGTETHVDGYADLIVAKGSQISVVERKSGKLTPFGLYQSASYTKSGWSLDLIGKDAELRLEPEEVDKIQELVKKRLSEGLKRMKPQPRNELCRFCQNMECGFSRSKSVKT